MDLLAAGAAEVIEWLTETHGLKFTLVIDFEYPGHSRRRMHGLPTRAGPELIDALRSACESQAIDIICGRRANTLFVEGHVIKGVATSSGELKEMVSASLMMEELDLKWNVTKPTGTPYKTHHAANYFRPNAKLKRVNPKAPWVLGDIVVYWDGGCRFSSRILAMV